MNVNKYSVTVETIDVERARALLAQFPRNRNSSPTRVNAYANIMRRGDWAPFSEVIIDEDGNTVDGHHRLEAVVKSGIACNMVVFRGLEKRFVPFIDTGRPRTAGDMLAFIEGIAGLPSLRDLSVIAKVMLQYESKNFVSLVPYTDLANFIINNKDTVMKAYEAYKMMRPKIRCNLCHAAAIGLIVINNPSSVQDIDIFVRRLALGENICAGMPTYAARNVILAKRANTGGLKMCCEGLYTILKAWSAEIKGEQVMRLCASKANTENVLSLKIIKEVK